MEWLGSGRGGAFAHHGRGMIKEVVCAAQSLLGELPVDGRCMVRGNAKNRAGFGDPQITNFVACAIPAG